MKYLDVLVEYENLVQIVERILHIKPEDCQGHDIYLRLKEQHRKLLATEKNFPELSTANWFYSLTMTSELLQQKIIQKGKEACSDFELTETQSIILEEVCLSVTEFERFNTLNEYTMLLATVTVFVHILLYWPEV